MIEAETVPASSFLDLLKLGESHLHIDCDRLIATPTDTRMASNAAFDHSFLCSGTAIGGQAHSVLNIPSIFLHRWPDPSLQKLLDHGDHF